MKQIKNKILLILMVTFYFHINIALSQQDTSNTFLAVYDNIWAEINPNSSLDDNQLMAKFIEKFGINSKYKFGFHPL